VGSTEEIAPTVFLYFSGRHTPANIKGIEIDAAVHKVGDAQVQAFHDPVQRDRD
jgi:hypothetical protein